MQDYMFTAAAMIYQGHYLVTMCLSLLGGLYSQQHSQDYFNHSQIIASSKKFN